MMLSGIKEKILNVKKNVNLLGNDYKYTTSNEKLVSNSNAGAPILTCFQKHWEDIHNLNESNAKQAEKLATEIELISKTVRSDKQNMEIIKHNLITSKLTHNIGYCLNQIKDIHDICEKIEEKLVNLEIVIDEVDFEKMKERHRYHLNNYKERKEERLVNLKLMSEKEYHREVEQVETSKKLLLEERQKVFQEAFKNDLELYKSLGSIPKLDLPRNGALLEEIDLDYDETELDQFFNEGA
ncbi:dysbindin protein homolog [Cylas formicarius]|uniref:dysbindin protein homolog n=1 Tax=Cylas formicarius TaxID=197179 RepID=UPI0029586516|nr:dysbindin protein homolog [Cylas formicarius]